MRDDDHLVIGLTGPTGSGKSTVARLLQEFGCGIIDCDQSAREVTSNCRACIVQLQEAFGKDICDTDGKLNRKLVAQRAFSNAENTKKLNQITHPWILRNIKEKIKILQNQNTQFIVIDAPLLFEGHVDVLCNIIVTVLAPVDTRIKRIMKRDQIDETLAKARIHAQHDDEYYTNRADYVIDGTLPLHIIKQQISEILAHLSGD